MNRNSYLRLAVATIVAALCLSPSGCKNPLGPGYIIEKQQIEVQFVPGDSAPPKIHVTATYDVRNKGTRPLTVIEARLPGGRRLHVDNMQATWDGNFLQITPSDETPRNSILNLPGNWPVSSQHTLRFSYEFTSAAPAEGGLSFTSDAFFLPSAGWNPELPQERGLFGFGGVPPKKWELTIRVPQGFLVHSSGAGRKQSRKGGEEVIRAVQQPDDHYPFVVAARYSSTEIGTGKQPVSLWTRSQPDPAILQQATQDIARTTAAYDAIFGTRAAKTNAPLWIVECPDPHGCLTVSNAAALLLGGEGARPTAEMISADTLIVDPSAGTPQLAASVAPSLASSWLGYGLNPGFYEQVPPLSQFPTFAAAIGREALAGPAYRGEVIRRALRSVPRNAAVLATPQVSHVKEEDAAVVRAKSLLFFYALQDRFGPEVFRKAVTHMLAARRGRGFDISDLIAAFDQEAHQNTAEFVRTWMKRPGVPDDFRAKYEGSSAGDSAKETFR